MGNKMNKVNMESIQQNIKDNNSCPVCQSSDLHPVLYIKDFPVISNLLWHSAEDATNTVRGDIQLMFCNSCGHVYNQAFDPSLLKYNGQYENSLGFSAVFQQYAVDLAGYLVEKYKLFNKNIIEIGCGKGDFLKLLCESGNNHGVGFDPSIVDPEGMSSSKIRFIADEYSEQYHYLNPDFLCSRHTLEHIFEPQKLIQLLRSTIGEKQEPVIFFEVPSLEYMLGNVSIWDVIYEHYSYFSRSSIQNLFSQSGISMINMSEKYGNQFLCFEGSFAAQANFFHGSINSQTVEDLRTQVDVFTYRCQEKIEYWQRKLISMASAGKKTALWGAGSKGISFLNLLKVKEEISYVIDVNPRKEGKYITGTGHKIISPNFLSDLQLDAIIIMNPLYQNEIQKTVEANGIKTTIISV
jgi:hypothetical protein